MHPLISRARTRLLINQPFFGSIAMSLHVQSTQDIPTMATDGKRLQFNPEFVERIGGAMTEAVICHEVMHVVLKHHTRRNQRDPEKWNIACDYAINDILINSGVKLPEDGLYDEQYHNQNAERIYDNLPDEDSNQPSGQRPQDFGIVVDLTNNDGSPMSEAEKSQHESQLDARIFEAAQVAERTAGTLPGGIKQLVERMRKPKVVWEDLIRKHLGGSTPDDYTFTRVNRKWLSSYNIYMPAQQKFGLGELAVIVDSSGSVRDYELEQFLGEMVHIAADLGATRITVITCDTKVQAVEHYEAGEHIHALNTNGRGGTRAKPAFDYLIDHGYEPDTIVYFTDGGLFDKETLVEPNCPVIWATTTEDSDFPFGEKVYVEINEAEEAI